MTTFTTWPFAATGATALRTLPNRLADVHNVKDFGAKGDGITDDYAAIMAAYNWTTNTSRGTIFFPPGTYYISQPLPFGDADAGVNAVFSGVMGASIITGNFANYIFNRDSSSGTISGDSGCHVIEKLTLINTNAKGGGVRWGMCVGGAIRDLNITANICINTGNADNLASLEISIENCQLSPGSNPTNSVGIGAFADGPILNCYMNGFAWGAVAWGNQGGQGFCGCHFENCVVGCQPGTDTTGSPAVTTGGFDLLGCYFKNCGTAINISVGGVGVHGVYIEGTDGQAPGGTNPQYGMYIAGGGGSTFEGITVTGQYDQYGIYVEGESTTQLKAYMFGVVSSNSGSGSAWGSGITPVAGMSKAPFMTRAGCNVSNVTTTNELIFVSPCTATCSGTTATLTVAWGNLNPYGGESFQITVSGMTPAGYNGTFTGTVTGTNTLTYTVASSLANGSGGEVVINALLLLEGQSFDVSDSNSSSWAGIVTGAGSTHAKVRYNGASLTVEGT
jgi:Pectate lyase superfamily protein